MVSLAVTPLEANTASAANSRVWLTMAALGRPKGTQKQEDHKFSAWQDHKFSLMLKFDSIDQIRPF